MQCPKCGAGNPEGSEYCSLCLEKLPTNKPDYNADTTGVPTRSGSYVAPGEWRGDAELLSPGVSSVVGRKMRMLYIKLAIYGVLALGLAVWLVLSLTLWCNPSPGKQAAKLIQALNSRDSSAFTQLVLPEAQIQGEALYKEIIVTLGSDGRFENVGFSVSQTDNYTARASISGGNITSGIYGPIDLGQFQNLVLVLENQQGKWYINPRDSILVPY
ncbi:MAG: hypothetical protein A2V52_02430 [Actinobacteria bacterium RBG_19FT_COMBO_54_7]|nr:MAG: hypothetical protein A2V52_02430 [Actinobacteria bacterium RBG_19FT_COMBO_54_7]